MEGCKRILAIFPSVHLYGKERSNIEVFRILQNDEHASLKILCNKEQSDNLKNALSGFDLQYCKFPDRASGRLRYIKYLKTFILCNMNVFRLVNKFKPNIIYLNNEMSVYDLFPILKMTNSDLVYRIGDIPAFPTLSGYKINRMMWNEIVVKKVKKIVSISKFIQNEIGKTGRTNHNDTVIYNYPPTRNSNIHYTKEMTDTLVLGYIGQIRHLKGVHLLVESVIELIKEGLNIKLLIAGDLQLFKDYSADLVKQVKDNNCASGIKFLNEISDISQFFGSIDILTIPTIWPEALGNVLVEAKQHHKPVIIFPSGGMPEIVRNSVDGYICHDKSKESLKKGIRYYYDNRNLVATQGEESYKSLEIFHIERNEFNKRWKDVFNI